MMSTEGKTDARNDQRDLSSVSYRPRPGGAGCRTHPGVLRLALSELWERPHNTDQENESRAQSPTLLVSAVSEGLVLVILGLSRKGSLNHSTETFSVFIFSYINANLN